MERFRLLLPVYVPTLLLSLGQGVLLPTLPLYAKSLGISFALVSIAVGAAGVGTLLADLPSGVLLERVGRRPVMLVGCGSVTLSCLLVPLFPHFAVLVVLQFILGVGTALWGISRHVFLADSIPPEERGRALSSFGGIMRIGTFGGPAIGGIVADRFGLASPFFISGALAAIALVISFLFIPEGQKRNVSVSTRAYLRTLGRVVVDNKGVLTSAGFAQLCTQMIRAGRQVIVPLYAAYALNLDVTSVGAIISISSAIDMFLFIPAGVLMDRMGRKAAIIPCFIILSVGMAMVPLSTGYTSLLIATTIMGFGNGIGSGTMMTLGADLAPPASVGSFLGVWRLIGDAGGAGGPIVVGGIADLIGLAASAYALAIVGLLAVALFAFTVPETGKRPRLDPTPASPSPGAR
jgi:MFS family permease